MPGGQCRITMEDLATCPTYLSKIIKEFVMVKAESAPLVAALNKSVLVPKIGLTACDEGNLVQGVTNCIARICSKLNRDPEEFLKHLITSCSFTVVFYATRLHVDTPRKHKLLKATSFWENKLLVEVPSRSTHDKKDLALGRGGAGRGKFVFGVLDHSYDLSQAYGWGDQNERGNGALFRELIAVAAQHGLHGPDAPALIEAALDIDIDHHLLSPP